ncbi:putative baseplate assembly protein [candidate division KSB1 bacterium]|nr:putative baseplate assembly protein [candidate division KSB1 bacterium]
MSETCGCCKGIEKLTPLQIANRPGLDRLLYRVGTHATFLETMLAGMRDLNLSENKGEPQLNPLLRLKTRALEDPAIALLDAWAAVADVLTFYQERIANEGFLLTTTERRSILELANLVGYRLRPGVSATVYLAFTMEDGQSEEILVGTRAQSIPGPGEMPQAFETAEKLEARAEWNALRPRLRRPQFITLDNGQVLSNGENLKTIYLKGTDTRLKINDRLLLIFGDAQNEQKPFNVFSVEMDEDLNLTKVRIEAPPPPLPPQPSLSPFLALRRIVRPLSVPVSLQPQTMRRLNRNRKQLFSSKTDIVPQLLVHQNRFLHRTLYSAWAKTQVAPAQPPSDTAAPLPLKSILAFRVKAAPFGHNAPKKPDFVDGVFQGTYGEWPLDSNFDNTKLSLDTIHDEIKSNTCVIIEHPNKDPKFLKASTVRSVSEANYGMSAKVTQIDFGTVQWTDQTKSNDLTEIRKITVYAQSEPLELAEEPITDDIQANTITLDGLFDGLISGRWVIVSGERVDEALEEEAVTASELVMLSGVEQRTDEKIPVDSPHTVLQFANNLAYRYKRNTVTIHGNVVRATHGETREEILGSGDSSRALQEFTLRQSPLTFISAATPTGIQSTLEVRVNNVKWHETDSLADKKPDARNLVTKTDNDTITSVKFGNGEHGARLPTGVENISALYRIGIGEAGNVAAKQISLLAIKPLGVKEVINPMPATGGADREVLDQARRNAPIHLRALDRTVSVQDYADFARAFTGIGKAEAVRMSDGRRELVHLTIAGANDIPIDKTSDLYRNLLRSLHLFGDPNQPLQVDLRELKLIILSAGVKLHPDFEWEFVEPVIRSTLLDAFGFERRAMGKDVLLSEVISTMQAVDGVDYVDVDILNAVGDELIEKDNLETLEDKLSSAGAMHRIPIHNARVDFFAADPAKRIRPAQLAILSPAVPDTLILAPLGD